MKWMEFTGPRAATLALVAWACLPQARALPSFARQTGQECAACHVGAFGPQLTPFGMRFKINGYTLTDGKSGHVPLAAAARVSTTRTGADNPDSPPGHANDNTTLDEASVFLAGKLASHVGAFIQVTHDGVAHHTRLDQTDLRLATPLTLAGHDTVWGVSLNNNPSVEDPFNTLHVWRFPYTSSSYGFDTGAQFVGFGGLEEHVLGLSAYTFWDDSLYAELGSYRSMSPTLISRLGAVHPSSDVTDHLAGNAYWRLAYTRNLGSQNWSAGLVGFDGLLHDRTSGADTAHFKDLGVDGSYQFLGTREHIVTVNTSYLREIDTVADTHTRELNLNASYYYQNTWGTTLGFFQTRTTQGANDLKGYIVQGDWTPWGKEDSWHAPWANVRLGLQYVIYAKFQGGSSYVDDLGDVRRARDNNTLYAFAWTAF